MRVTAIWQNNLTRNIYFKTGVNSKWIKKENNFNLLFEEKDLAIIKKILYINRLDKKYIKNVESGWKDVFNINIIRTVFNEKVSFYKFSKIIKEIEEKGKKIYGYNIMDIFEGEISDKISDKKIWYLDIEVEENETKSYNKNIPISISADGTIISIAYYDSYIKDYYALVLQPNINQNLKNTDNIKYFKREEDLLNYFNNLIKEQNPDIISGWYSDGFDIPYIINRARKFNIEISSIEKLKPFSSYKKLPGGFIYKNVIPGINLLDYMDLYKKFMLTQPNSYKLDNIAKFHDIKGKTEYKGFLNYRKDFEKFLAYIFRDVEILVELEKKLNLNSLICGLQSVIKIPLNMLMANSITIDHYLQQFLLPQKQTFQRMSYGFQDSEADFEGAIVLQPEDKKYKNTIVLDYASLYPNTILTYNISPETLIYDKNYKGKHVDMGLILEEENKNYLPLKYTLEKEGVFPSLIRFLLKERLKYKSLKNNTPKDDPQYIKYDIKQSNYKILLNSMYGVIGTSRFPLHDKRVAASITAGSRSALKYMNKKLNNKRFENININKKIISFKTEVIYSDTDSSFNVIHTEENLNAKDLEDIGKFLASYINTNIAKELTINYSNTEEITQRCTFSVDVDKLFETVRFFGVKKRYFGHDFAKNIITHGVEIVRSDTPQSIKEILTDLFIKSLDEELKEEDLLEYFEKIKAMPIEDIAIYKNITKTDFSKYKTIPNHVRGVQIMQKIYNFQYKYEDRLLYYYIKYLNKKNYLIIENIFNINIKSSEPLISSCIESEHIEEFKKLIENKELEIDYYTFFEKNILSRLEQFSENIHIIQAVKSKLEKQEGITQKADQLRLF